MYNACVQKNRQKSFWQAAGKNIPAGLTRLDGILIKGRVLAADKRRPHLAGEFRQGAHQGLRAFPAVALGLHAAVKLFGQGGAGQDEVHAAAFLENKAEILDEVIDEEIAALEQKIAKLDSEIEMAATQYSRLTELTQEKSELEEQLEFKMNRWVELNELAELIEQQKQK